MNVLWLFAQAAPPTATEPWWTTIVRGFGENPGALVGLVAVIGGISYAIVKAVMRHKERMAMIERGMNPTASDGRSRSSC